LLEGVPGTGKTSLAYLMLNQIGIPSGDILYINATRERKIEDIQTKIIGFVGSWALGPTGIKYIILDEADAMSPLAQRLLRGEMETYHRECRFILTCNYAVKIIPAVHSRCQTYTFRTLDRDDFTARIGEILMRESVAFEIDDLLKLVELSYPDMRKCINLAQEATLNRVLQTPREEAAATKDYLVEMVNLFKSGRTNDARKLIITQAQVEEYPDIYRFLYQNLQFWGQTEDQQDNALLIIRKGLVNHGLIADPEINLSATLVELKMNAQGVA
ncbi:MAG: AAA family ATPase, partial [Verrucomicrobiaceae bacterium]